MSRAFRRGGELTSGSKYVFLVAQAIVSARLRADRHVAGRLIRAAGAARDRSRRAAAGADLGPPEIVSAGGTDLRLPR
jgi:hypothetical protein